MALKIIPYSVLKFNFIELSLIFLILFTSRTDGPMWFYNSWLTVLYDFRIALCVHLAKK